MMNKLILPVATALGLFASTSAHADPCVLVTKSEAINATRWLGSTFGAKYLEYCESCGDIYPTSKTVKAVSFAWGPGQRELFELKVNGQVIALGTTYVKVDTNADGKLDTFQNLAELVGCDPGIPTSHFDEAAGEGAKQDEADEDFSDVTASDAGGCSATSGGSTSLLAVLSLGMASVGRRRRRRATT
jgi:uncharacterized protein (TIGR03382 family)